MTRYAVRLVLAPAAPVTQRQADALVDLLTPDGGEAARIEWWGGEINRVIVQAGVQTESCFDAEDRVWQAVSAVLPGVRVTEIGAREQVS